MEMKARFEVGAAGRLLEERFARMEVDEVLTYEEASAVACVPDVRKHREVYRAAWERLRKAKGMVFACVPKVGFKRVSDAGKVSAVEDCHSRAVRQAKKGLGLVAAVDVAALDQAQVRRLNVAGFKCQLTAAVARHPKQISEAAEVARGLSPRQIVDAITAKAKQEK